jgi:hypothetical protein
MRRRRPFWVIRVVLTVGQPLPVCPNQRTFAGFVGMSQTCQKKQAFATT